MAIAIDYILPRTQIVATAGQTSFSTIWTADAATDIIVYARASGVTARDVDQIVDTDDYTVTFVGSELTVRVDFLVGRTDGDIITIVRDTPADRMNLFNNSNFLPSMLNGEIGRLVFMFQQSELFDKNLSPKYNTSETPYDVDWIIDGYLPLLPPLHVWMKNAENTMIIPFDITGLGAPVDATYILQTANDFLPNAQALDELANGVMVNKDGVIDTKTITGINGINVINGDGQSAGDIQIDGSAISGAGIVQITINQAGHGFVKSDWIRFRGSDQTWVKALANTAVNAEVVGMVTEKIDDDNFKLQLIGLVENLDSAPYYPLSPGDFYFLSQTDSGEISLVEPTDVNSVRKPVFVAIGANKGIILNYVGMENETDIGAAVAIFGNPIITMFTQSGHGLVVGNWVKVYNDTGTGKFNKAQADTFANAQAVGMVIKVDGDDFWVQTAGYCDVLSGLGTPAQLWWLDPGTAGAMTTTKPTAPNHYTKPLFVNLTDGAGFILEQRQLSVPVADGVSTQLFNQPGHGFVVSNVLKGTSGSVYAKAQADTLANSRAVGMVVWKDTDNFIIQSEGFTSAFTTLGLSANTEYYLSAAAPGGLITATEPTASGQVSRYCYYHLSDSVGGWIRETRPMLQPNANGGGSGSGGSVLLDDTDVTGLTEYTFEGFSSTYYKYFIELEDVVWINSTTELWAFFGTGSPVVYDTAASYVTQGVPLFNLYMNLAVRGIAIGYSPVGPLNARYQLNDLTKVSATYQKVLQLIAGSQKIEAGPVYQFETTATYQKSYLWYNSGVSTIAGTGFKIDPTNNGASPSGAFSGGRIRIYGVPA